ncbi:hypothetical protein F6P71_03020 [Streptococcus suis]|nr:hypothetical protein DP111_08720 [Streptococcus suis]MBL1132161.1 hypothetical protein [Streptococcus suis]MBO8111826.1 hypothetical protein [Streptococcus suis]MBS8079029.1 hypothetical protein [Streptococcus suis]MBS8090462.1 hypothetical protein [Streptococcus suis]
MIYHLLDKSTSQVNTGSKKFTVKPVENMVE